MSNNEELNENKTEKLGSKKKRLSKGKIIALSIVGALLLVLILFTVLFVVPNWGNLKAAYIWLTTSSEDIEKNINKAKSEQADAINNAGLNASTEMIDAFTKGEITQQQFNDILLGRLTLEDALAANAPTDNVNSPPTSVPVNLEAVDAYEKGEITAEQLMLITENVKTLEEIRAENELNKQTQENNGTASDTSETNPDTSQEPQVTPDTPSQTQTPDTSAQNQPTFTQEVLDAYKNGEITDNQLAEIGKNNMTLEQAKNDNQSTQTPTPPVSNDTAQTPPASTQTGTQSVDEQIAALVTKMYVLKADYEGAIAGIVEQMKADYAKLPAEQRTTSAKSSIASGYMSTINAMEAQCDAQVNTVVADLRKILKDNGRDTALADSIVSTYATEKENTKAYYLSKYGD